MTSLTVVLLKNAIGKVVFFELCLIVFLIGLLLEGARHLTVHIMGVRNHVLVSIEVYVKLMVLEHRKEVEDDIRKVRVPLSPNWVVQHSCFPQHIGIFVPLDQCLVDPLVHIVPLLSNHGVVANNVTQAFVLSVQKHMASRTASIRVIGT